MSKSIYSCLWFDDNAKTAADFYCSVFNRAKIWQDSAVAVSFEINGTRFMALNGGPAYKTNAAVSYYVYCGSEEEISRMYTMLSDGGKIRMPLDKYDWSAKYAWVTDRFGIDWQLDIGSINFPQHIVPTLLFANEKATKVKEAIMYYTGLFEESDILLEAPFPPAAGLQKGILLFAQFELRHSLFNAMSGGTAKHDFDFDYGNSFVVECDTQEQIDRYWDTLVRDGEESRCGWLKDKFGVAWQIIPAVLSKLMRDPEKAPRVMQALMQMKKLDIATLLKV